MIGQFTDNCRDGRISSILLILLMSVFGCEAPLQLDNVEQRRNEPIHRFDRFQAAASHGNTIVVVGNQGLVLISQDGGNRWSRERQPEWPALIDVTACTDGVFAALAIEGQVWVSTDNGNQWIPHPINSEEAPQAVTCDPQNRLWVVGSFSSIFMSSDAGNTWTLNSLDEDLILTNIQFLDRQNAVISGEFGTFLRSVDGGNTWERMPPLEDDFYPQDMFFIDPDTGWIVGLAGRILHTTDGGNSWQYQESNTFAPLYGIERVGDEMYVTGGEGVVLKFEGEKWVRVNHGKPIRLYLKAALAVDSDRLLVAGDAGVLYILPVNNLQQTKSNQDL